ncbi:MAG: amino acid permease [Chloroflexota bacterium]
MEEQSLSTEETEVHSGLSRDLGLTSALAIGVGTMIAAGIFTLSGLAVAKVGSGAIAAFLLAAIVATFTALTYCEFTSIYPESGEGYLYARKTFPAPLAYMVGWCLLLGYIASCGFYIASLSSYFNEFIWHAPVEMFSGLVAVAALTLLNIKGTKESGSFQVVVTIGKVLLLLWFVIGGLSYVDTALLIDRFSTDILKLGSTAALVFITFFGFSAIAASAGEVKNPTQTIPRAIFISMGIVTVLYTLVVLVVVSANLTEYSESAMGTAATNFLGPIGGMVIVGGALFSMISASNASIMAGSRVALSMSQLGHLPREIGAINAQTRTPVISLLLVGIGIGTSALLLPLEDLAHFADCILLTALILVNAALISHRRKYPEIERPFRVPLVPLLPLLGILANIYLLFQIIQQGHVVPALLAALSLALGFAGYLTWKGTQAETRELPGQPSRVALEQSASRDGGFRILVPIANPDNVKPLIDLAAAIAGPRNGEIVALRVAIVPEQSPPTLVEANVEEERRILETARARALEHDVPISSLVRVGHNAARAILETSRSYHCQLIILGWKGHTSTAQRIMGRVTDDVVNHARTDIMLVKLISQEQSFRRILLPTANGEHARRAADYAGLMADSLGSSMTLCSIASPGESQQQIDAIALRLDQAKERIASVHDVETKVIDHSSIEEGILEESKNYDVVVIGATRDSFTQQILFGSIPETIARDAQCAVIVVKRHHAVKALVGRVMSE